MFSYTARDKSHCFNTQPCSWHLTSFDSKHRADQVDSLLTLEIKWDVLQVIFCKGKVWLPPSENSLPQYPELRDPSINPASAPVTPRSVLCMWDTWPWVTHTSQRALFSHTWTTSHLSINRLDPQGHLCCPVLSFPALSSPALFHRALSESSPDFLSFSIHSPSFSSSPALCLLCFLTLMGGSGSEVHEARAEGLALSLIRNQERVLHWQFEPECPSWEEVSVTALSTYCQSDCESNTSRDGGIVNIQESQGQFNVTAPWVARAWGWKVCWPQEDNVRCPTLKYGSHTSPFTGNTGAPTFCCFLSHVKAYTWGDTQGQPAYKQFSETGGIEWEGTEHCWSHKAFNFSKQLMPVWRQNHKNTTLTWTPTQIFRC